MEFLLIIWAFGAVMAAVWFFLPFAVFGVKSRLDTLIKEQRRTNYLLEKALNGEVAK